MESYQQGHYQLHTKTEWCKGCALCVQSCPKGILYLNGRGKIAVSDIDRCIFCGICDVRCPDFAIWVVKPQLDGQGGEEGEAGHAQRGAAVTAGE